MIQNKYVISALPLVADILGRKYGVRVHIGGNGAYTDGRDIYLPGLPLDSDDTVRNLVRAFIDHESGHLRHTDFAELRAAQLTPLEHHIFNTLEDWRVEQRMGELFPGCRHNLIWLIKHMFLKPEPDQSTQPTNPAAAILNWILYTVRAWDVPALAPKRNQAAADIEEGYPGLMPQLAAVMADVPKQCLSTQDCIDSAREIVGILKQYLAAPPQQQKDPNKGHGKQNTKGDSANKGDPEGKSGAKPQTTNEQPTPQPDTASAEASPTPGEHLQELLDATGAQLPDDVGTLLAESLSAIKPERGERLQVAACTEKRKSPFPSSDLDDARKATTALRTRLQGLLQSQVQALSRTGRRGRLDTHALHRLLTGNPRVFRQQGEKQGLNAAVHVLLDCSGSMSGPAITLAGKACFAVASALSGVPGVSVAVMAFPGDPARYPDGGMGWKTVAPILKHGERMHGEFSLAANGDTPLGEALWWVLQNMQAVPESRRIILIVTDGYPDSRAVALQAISTATALEYEIYGIGIGEQTGIRGLLPTDSITILNLPELAPAMLSLLSKSLLTSRFGAKSAADKIRLSPVTSAKWVSYAEPYPPATL